MKNKMVKKYLVGMLTLTALIAGIVVVPKDVTAAGISSFKEGAVVYQKVDKREFESKCGISAPNCDVTEESSGYLFGGWYEYVDDSRKGDVITEQSQVDTAYVYAKFVPARLCGVFCQVDADTNLNTKTNMRVISAVDSTNYQAVGFNVYGRRKSGDNVTDWNMYTYKADGTNKAQSTKVYTGLQTYKIENSKVVPDTLYTPSDLYGTYAQDFKFTTMNLSNIPVRAYGDTIIAQPYWITMDGTYVEGTLEFNRVNDSPDVTEAPIVNISVNLKNTTDIAAGMVNVTIPDGFTYVEAECGRVFEEMGVDSSDTKMIKFVGNVADIRKNSEKPNDVIVNLRLRKTGNPTAGASTFKVTIPTNGFCDKDEALSTVTAWDVVY